jgi:hypothetical protein
MIEDEEWFGGGFDFEDDYEDVAVESSHISFVGCDLEEIMNCIRATEADLGYCERAKLVEVKMGSMALCRGQQGEELREAGAIHALLSTLMELLNKIPTPRDPCTSDTETELAIKLAIACWGAARDLGCGSAGNREALREIKFDGMGGMKLLSKYLELYDGVYWDEIDRLHLKLLTGFIGTIRNVTHSTAENCTELHEYGVSTMLMWRLKHGSSQDAVEILSLPDAFDPWREGAFRSASALINMAEKCHASAALSGTDPGIIRLLVESWGGTQKKLPVLHLGLAAVLRCAKEQLPPHLYDHGWDGILDNEKQRKVAAQTREEERKRVATSSD